MITIDEKSIEMPRDKKSAQSTKLVCTFHSADFSLFKWRFWEQVSKRFETFWEQGIKRFRIFSLFQVKRLKCSQSGFDFSLFSWRWSWDLRPDARRRPIWRVLLQVVVVFVIAAQIDKTYSTIHKHFQQLKRFSLGF